MLAGPLDRSVRHQVLRDRRAGYEATMSNAGLEPMIVTSNIGYEPGVDPGLFGRSERPIVAIART